MKPNEPAFFVCENFVNFNDFYIISIKFIISLDPIMGN